MPTYVYACTECGHQFEAHQSFSDASLTECPNCSGKLRKVFNSVGIVFKGSGFYRTDSREKATGGAPAAEKAGTPAKSDSASSGSSGSSGSSDSSSAGSSSSGSSSSGSSSSGSSSSGSSGSGSSSSGSGSSSSGSSSSSSASAGSSSSA